MEKKNRYIVAAQQHWLVKAPIPLPFFFPQIGSNIFLTAAHCLQNYDGVVQETSQLKIILGVQNRRSWDSTSRARFLNSRMLHVTEVVIHQYFDFTREVNDLAVLKISKYLFSCNMQEMNHIT